MPSTLFSDRARLVAANRERIEATGAPSTSASSPASDCATPGTTRPGPRAAPPRDFEAETPEELIRGRHKSSARQASTSRPPCRAVRQVQESAVGLPGRAEELARDAPSPCSRATKSAWSDGRAHRRSGRSGRCERRAGRPQAVSELAEDVGARAVERCMSLLDPVARSHSDVAPSELRGGRAKRTLRSTSDWPASPATMARETPGARRWPGAGLSVGQAEAVGALCSPAGSRSSSARPAPARRRCCGSPRTASTPQWPRDRASSPRRSKAAQVAAR